MSEAVFDKIILASASPRRHELLNQVNMYHTIEVSNVEEIIDNSLLPDELVKSLSHQKASAVAQMHKGENVAVIGADTVVVLDNEILGKPSDENDAKNMLKKLSGRTHCVITGVTVINPLNNCELTKSVETMVKFLPLDDKTIEEYVLTGEPMDKAGAYGIQGLGAIFVECVSGDYYNVVGLPIASVSAMLEVLGGK